MTAPAGQDVRVLPVPDDHDGDIAEHPLRRLAFGEAGEAGGGHEIVPSRFDEVGDWLGLIGSGGLAVGDVAAEEAAHGRSGQAGQPQLPGPGWERRRRRVAGDCGGVRECVHHPDAHLLFVLFRPVGSAGQRGRHRRRQASQHQPPGSRLVARPQVQEASRQPGACRDLHQRRMQRVPQLDAVQRIADPAWWQQPRDPLTGAGQPVQAFGPLKVTDEVHEQSATRPPAAKRTR